jgi:rRNA maturation protein Nop10
MKHILKCEKCNKFTMKKICECGEETKSLKPQRYSPQKFAEYRREARKENLKERGLI